MVGSLEQVQVLHVNQCAGARGHSLTEQAGRGSR